MLKHFWTFQKTLLKINDLENIDLSKPEYYEAGIGALTLLMGKTPLTVHYSNPHARQKPSVFSSLFSENDLNLF